LVLDELLSYSSYRARAIRFLRNQPNRGRAARSLPAGGGRCHRPAAAVGGSRAAAGRSEGPRSALEAAAVGRGMWPGGRDNGRSAAGCRVPAAAPQARPFHPWVSCPGGAGQRDASAINGVGETGPWVSAHGPVRRSAGWQL
jgi:hypothetical protein